MTTTEWTLVLAGLAALGSILSAMFTGLRWRIDLRREARERDKGGPRWSL